MNHSFRSWLAAFGSTILVCSASSAIAQESTVCTETKTCSVQAPELTAHAPQPTCDEQAQKRQVSISLSAGMNKKPGTISLVPGLSIGVAYQKKPNVTEVVAVEESCPVTAVINVAKRMQAAAKNAEGKAVRTVQMRAIQHAEKTVAAEACPATQIVEVTKANQATACIPAPQVATFKAEQAKNATIAISQLHPSVKQGQPLKILRLQLAQEPTGTICIDEVCKTVANTAIYPPATVNVFETKDCESCDGTECCCSSGEVAVNGRAIAAQPAKVATKIVTGYEWQPIETPAECPMQGCPEREQAMKMLAAHAAAPVYANSTCPHLAAIHGQVHPPHPVGVDPRVAELEAECARIQAQQEMMEDAFDMYVELVEEHNQEKLEWMAEFAESQITKSQELAEAHAQIARLEAEVEASHRHQEMMARMMELQAENSRLQTAMQKTEMVKRSTVQPHPAFAHIPQVDVHGLAKQLAQSEQEKAALKEQLAKLEAKLKELATKSAFVAPAHR